MRPPIRLAALMGLHVIYVFTHDSIALGEDGPTHQPVEQLAGLRAIPNLTVIRPADANETAVAWRVAIETRDRPVALVLTRQDVPTLDRAHVMPRPTACGAARTCWPTRPSGKPELILIATGSEVALIVAAREQLLARGHRGTHASRCRAGSLFDAQPQAYRDAVLPPSVGARLAVEAGVAARLASLRRRSRRRARQSTVSALRHPARKSSIEYGFTVDNVCNRARTLLGQMT